MTLLQTPLEELIHGLGISLAQHKDQLTAGSCCLEIDWTPQKAAFFGSCVGESLFGSIFQQLDFLGQLICAALGLGDRSENVMLSTSDGGGLVEWTHMAGCRWLLQKTYGLSYHRTSSESNFMTSSMRVLFPSYDVLQKCYSTTSDLSPMRLTRVSGLSGQKVQERPIQEWLSHGPGPLIKIKFLCALFEITGYLLYLSIDFIIILLQIKNWSSPRHQFSIFLLLSSHQQLSFLSFGVLRHQQLHASASVDLVRCQ